MAPPIRRTDDQVRVNHHPPHRKEADTQPQPTIKKSVEGGRMTRLGDLQAQAQQRRERLERLIPAATAGISAANDIRLLRAGVAADKAQKNAYQKANQEFKRVQPDISARAQEIALTTGKRERYNMDDYRQAVAEYRKNTGYTGPTDMVEVSRRADNAYREVLAKEGFKASDVRGDSAAKAADFMTSRADDGKPFSVLAESAVKSRVAENKPTGDYFVRLVERVHMTGGEPMLTRTDKAWMALTDESAGAKLTARGLMKHVGFDGATIDNPKTQASDWVLMITKRDGQADVEVPTWESRMSEAKGHDDFRNFNAQPETEKLYRDVRKYSELEIKHGKTTSGYKPDVKEFWAAADLEKKSGGELKPKRFAEQKVAAGEMTPYQAELFKARNQMQNTFGMNENFGGEGYAVSPDGQVTGRELIVKNGKVAEQPQHIFLELRDGKFPSQAEIAQAVREGKPSPLEIVRNTKNVDASPLRLGSEIKGGAVVGGAISAVTSLGEVYDRTKTGDYKGAATTFAVNTGAGATIGGVSAAGERIVGRGIENFLSRSTLANKGLEKLYTSDAARSAVSRLVQTETSTISSQTFNTALRTVGGRIGGAGIVGGLVSGGFSAYDQIGAYRRGEVRGAQAFGTVVGETAVGVGAGAAGAAAGAAIGVWFGGVGAVPGAIIGFGVGMAAGYISDKVLRGMGVDKAIAKGVTATIDAGSRAAGAVRKSAGQAVQAGRQFVGQQVRQARAVYNSASSAVSSARTFVSQRANQARAAVSSGTRAAVNYVSQVGRRAVSAVRNTASQAVNQVRSTVSNVANQVSSTVSNVANQARSAVSNAVSNVTNSAVSNLRSVFSW